MEKLDPRDRGRERATDKEEPRPEKNGRKQDPWPKAKGVCQDYAAFQHFGISCAP